MFVCMYACMCVSLYTTKFYISFDCVSVYHSSYCFTFIYLKAVFTIVNVLARAALCKDKTSRAIYVTNDISVLRKKKQFFFRKS